MENYQFYNELLSFSYEDLVQHLLSKYGIVEDNYFKEESYNKFLNGKIKSITKGAYSKAKDGLYCHHILENKYENISSIAYIKEYQYPYELQKKENLVYCNLLEHLILHALIMKETSGVFGTKGFEQYLRPMVVEWYVKKIKKPDDGWLLAVFNRSFLSKDNTINLLTNIDIMLSKYVKNYQI